MFEFWPTGLCRYISQHKRFVSGAERGTRDFMSFFWTRVSKRVASAEAQRCVVVGPDATAHLSLVLYLSKAAVVPPAVMRSPPTYGEICDIANRAVTIFTECGYQCCLFGSTACALYGVTRCPNDVDLVVLATPNTSTEYLKQLLVNEPNDFYLVPSKKRDANYKVLWYRLPPGARGKKRKCKVDVLVPGMLNIPAVPSAQVAYARHLPVMPLLPLLLLKLQGWTDHRDSDRRDFRRKQHVDVEDVKELLSFACDLRVRIGSRELGWLPADFVEAAQNRIHEFVGEFPESVLRWRSLGFEAF